jgi:hypothetical protein
MRLGRSRLYGNVGTGPINDVETNHDVFGPSCFMRYASRITSSDHQLLSLLASASLGRLPSDSLTCERQSHSMITADQTVLVSSNRRTIRDRESGRWGPT